MPARNRLVASLAASLIGLLFAATVGSLIGWTRMSRLARSQGLAAERELGARLVATEQKEAAEEARKHESAQRQLAEEARHQAESALQGRQGPAGDALANFAKARAAVDNYLTKVSESQLLQVPGLQPLRRDLLQSAMGFYQDFLKERSDDPSLRAELAATQVRVGRIYTDLGLAAERRAILETAVAAYEAALAKAPRDLAIRAALADTWQAVGDLAYEHGKKERGQDMLAAYQKSIEQREALVRARPADLDYQKNLALAWNRLGIAQSALGRSAPALHSYHRSTEIRHVLIRELPGDPTLHYALGESFLNLATLLSTRGRHWEALAMYVRSQEFYRFAYGKLPNMIEYGCDLGSTYLSAGQSYRSLGREQEAIAELQKGVEHFRRMVRDHPAVPVVERRLIAALKSLAAFHQAMGQPVAAARTLREAGQWLDKEPKEGPDAIFQNACFHAKQSIPVAQGDEPPTSQEQIDARREAERAIEQLTRAIEEGFDKLDAIRTTEDLAPLRGRDDFKQLVAKLADHLDKRPRASTGVATHDGPWAPLPKTDAERARQEKIDRATSLHAVGLVQLSLNRLEQAQASLEEARALREQLAKENPKDVRTLTELAWWMIAQGTGDWKAGRLAEATRLWREAEDLLSRAESQAPESQREPTGLAAARQAIGAEYARRGLWAEAANLYARAFESGLSSSASEYRHAAILTLTAGDKAAYQRLCTRILNRVDKSTEQTDLDRADYGWALVLAPGGLSEPTRALQMIGTDAPDKAAWYNHALALALYRCGRPEEAVRRLDQWDGRNEGWKASGADAALLALALHRLGRADEAQRALEQAQAMQTRKARVIFDLEGEIGGQWSDWAHMLVLCREAEKAIHGRPGPDPSLARLAAARLYAKLGHAERAQAEMRAVVAATPGDPAVWLARGRVFAELGRLDRSNADFAQAAALPSTDPIPWIQHGRWLAQRGDHAPADSAFARAATLTPNELNRFLEPGWWVAGPYPGNFGESYPPEQDADPSRPVAAAFGPNDLKWQLAPIDQESCVHLGTALGTKANESAYALNIVYSPDERPPTLLVGGDHLIRLWVNGRLVRETTAASTAPEALDRVPIVLKSGRNTLLARVSRADKRHKLFCRLADSPADRVLTLAQKGLWPEALIQARLVQPDSGQDSFWLARKAALHLLAVDHDGYEHVCRQVAGRALAGDPHAIGTVVNAPNSSLLMDRLIDAAKKSVTPTELWARNRLALVYYRAGQFDRAVAEWEKSGDPSRIPGLAMGYYRLGRNADAERVLIKSREWITDRIENIRANSQRPLFTRTDWFELANQYILYVEAHWLIRGADSEPELTLLPVYVAAREAEKAADPATADFDFAISDSPDQRWLYLARARRLAELNRTYEADADFARAVALQPDDLLERARDGLRRSGTNRQGRR